MANHPEADTLSVTQIIDPADPLNPIAITSAGQSVTLASGTAVIVNGDGTVSVTSPLTTSGTETFDYQVGDGNGGFDTATVTLALSSGNQDPTANPDVETVDEDMPLNGNVLTNDTDPNAGLIR